MKACVSFPLAGFCISINFIHRNNKPIMHINYKPYPSDRRFDLSVEQPTATRVHVHLATVAILLRSLVKHSSSVSLPYYKAPLHGCLAAINNSTKETRSWAPRGNPYACSSLPSGESAPLVALKALYIDARIRFEAESFALMGFHYRY